MAAEIKLLVAAPSAKNWPLALAGGFLLVLTAAVGFALQALSSNAAVLTAAAGVALVALPILSAANTSYLVTSARVTAVSGILGKTEVSVPLDTVRELRLKRSPVQRALGLGDLEVVGSGGSVTLAGIEEPEAARERILGLAA
ncbi:PH domain-containing protein [bacterium]|nr:MAG: PH domain-containing protein [bacterium]